MSELNPFEVYRRLRGAVLRYSDVFGILGGCRVAISPMSSKLMSLGALLVAYELKACGYRVGVAHVDAQGYRLRAVCQERRCTGCGFAVNVIVSKKKEPDVRKGRPAVTGMGLVALDMVITEPSDREPRFFAGGTCGNVLTILSYLGWAATPVARLRRG